MPLLSPHIDADGHRVWMPVDGPAEQLMILFHGVGGAPESMVPLARALRAEFPQAALVAARGFDGFDAGVPGGGDPASDARQWFSIAGVTEENRPARVAAVLPRLHALVQSLQQRVGVGTAATALVGFSQGAICSLELAQAHDGLAGRVLSFAGRYAALPTEAPRETTLHLFHGAADPVIPAQNARTILERMAALQGDATVDIFQGIGHELPPAMMRRAIERLRSHIPHRTWVEAMGGVPPHARTRARPDDEADAED